MKQKEIITYILIIVIGLTFAHYMNVVVSGSMEPVFYKGDIVIINYDTSSINEGDIIIYEAKWFENKHVIHRVIAKEKSNGNTFYILKGDNNANQDPEPVSPNQIISKVVKINNKPIVIPKIGYITIWFQEIPKYFFSSLESNHFYQLPQEPS